MKFFWYDIDYVEDRLIDATLVHEAMPDREAGWLRSGTRSTMPETLKERETAYYEDFLEEAGVDRRPPPTVLNDLTQRRIDLAYDCMGWTLFAKPNERKIIGAVILMKTRGINPPRWGQIHKKIAPGYRSRQTVINHYKLGMGRIVDELNKKIRLTNWMN